MKLHKLTIFTSILLISNLYAQELKSTREQKYRIEGKENYVFITASTGASSHNQLLAIAKVEYSRQIKGNWFWGATMQNNFALGRLVRYDAIEGGGDPYANSVHQNIFTLNGMAYYRISIVKDRIFLRPGLGLGLGYHYITDHIDNPSELNDKVLPYLNAELTWLIRLTKHIDLKFSPTIILTPQSFSISPIKLGGSTDVLPYHYDAMFNIGLGVRF